MSCFMTTNSAVLILSSFSAALILPKAFKYHHKRVQLSNSKN